MYIFQIYFLGFLFSKPVPVLVEEKKGSKKDVAGKLALVYKWGKKVNIQTERITFIFTTKDVLLLSSPSRLLHLLHTLQIAFTTPSCRYCGSLLFLLLPWGNTERAKEKQQDHFWAFCVCVSLLWENSGDFVLQLHLYAWSQSCHGSKNQSFLLISLWICHFCYDKSHRRKGCLIARCTQKQDQKNNPQPNNKGTQNSPLL